MIPLETIGFDVLTEKSRGDFQKLFRGYAEKIEHKLRNIELIRIHLKEYNYRGDIADKRNKFSIHALVKYAGKIIEADAHDWDLKRALHKLFKKIEEEIERVFHVSDQHQKRR
jgi:ribosome-associated translation inhibitor RaiA